MSGRSISSRCRTVKPNGARNLGVARTTTEYVVIADNDIEYEPGWLDALEVHAEENGSAAVAPLICIGPPAATIIHHAGGMLSAETVDGGVVLHERHRLMDVPLADAAGDLPEASNRASRSTSRCERSPSAAGSPSPRTPS